MPRPDARSPAKGIQSTRKAVWSLTITAEASRRVAARRAVSRSRPLNDLCPLALHAALPRSLVGRYSHDYYGHSVTLGLSLSQVHISTSLHQMAFLEDLGRFRRFAVLKFFRHCPAKT